MTETKLKPCPFCGSEARVKIWWDSTCKSAYKSAVVVCCRKCKAEMREAITGAMFVIEEREKLIEAWNTRAGETK